MPTEVIDAVLLPEAVQRGAVSKISDPIDVIPGDSLLEQRRQKSPSRRIRTFQVGYNVKLQADRQEIINLYNTNGQTQGFLFRDYSDLVLVDETIGTGDGATLTFNAIRTYSTAARTLVRRYTRLVASSVVVKVDGVAVDPAFYTLGTPGNGTITFGALHAPANTKLVKLSATTLVPVRFNGELQIHVDTVNKISLPTVELKELFETAA